VCEAKERKVEIMYVAYIWQCRIDPPAFFIILCSTPGIGGGRNDVCTVHGSSHFLLPADGFFFFFFKGGKKEKHAPLFSMLLYKNRCFLQSSKSTNSLPFFVLF
jgi:hypothetical protein